MDIKIMKEALKCYAQHESCPMDDMDKVLEAIGECQATIDRIKEDGDDFKEAYNIHTIPSIVLTDFLNLTTYDVYGKVAKQHGGKGSFDRYMYKVRDIGLGFNMLTAAQVMCGYDLLSDLWHDNEESGDNNPDGTFKREDDKFSIGRNLLRRVIRRLDDKLTVDREYMEADDVEALLEEINSLKELAKR